MLSLTTGSGRTRREFLKIGGLGLGGLTWGDFLARHAAAGSSGGSPITGKTVIFLFMQGGPTQFETFDPKVEVSDEIRSVGGAMPTTVPGTAFGQSFTRLSQLAHKIAVVRSFRTNTQHGGLDPIVNNGRFQGASLGSVYNRIAGPNHRETGLPSAVHLIPKSVLAESASLRDRFGRFDAPGQLGTNNQPFVPAGDGPLQDNMKLHLDSLRLDDRRHLLAGLDRFRYGADAAGLLDGLDGMRQQAFEMLVKGVGDAFDVSKESPETLARYDTSAYYKPALWGKKNNDPWYTCHTKTLGKLLLLARRLAEAGCGFVTINTEFVWDFHADGNNVAVDAGRPIVIEPFDHAVSAFIEDCEARGLSDRILLVCCGEMGRTPKINKNGGRDHWPQLAPLMLYGGGLTHGQVVGSSTRDGAVPATEPLEPANLLANISRHLFDFANIRLMRGLPAELMQDLNRIEQIPRILS